MKRHYLIYAFGLIVMSAFLNQVISNSGGAPSGRTGSPIDTGTCKSSGCHNSFELDAGNGSMSVFTNIPSTGYVPGQTYTVNINLTETGRGRFGFESSAFSPSANANIGTVALLNSNETKINPGAGNYVTHTASGINNTDFKDWSYDWTAPDPGMGTVYFYTTGVIADANGNPGGDHVYTALDSSVQGIGIAIDPIRETFEAKVYPTVADQQVFVELENLDRGTLHLHITNISGQKVFDLEQEVTTSQFSTAIPVQSFAPGVYLMTLSHQGRRGYEKFIVK